MLWDDIFHEYLALTNDSSNMAYLELIKAEKIFTVIAYAIDILCAIVVIDQEFNGFEAINNELRSLTGHRGDGVMSEKEFRIHQNIGKSFEKKAESKRFEIEAINNGSKRMTKKDWYDQLLFLSKYQGYRLDPLTCSVLEYCSILNNFKHEAKAKQKENVQ